MINKLMMVFSIPELRQKIFLTFVLLAVYRLGFAIPLPIIDQNSLQEMLRRQTEGEQDGLGKMMTMISLFSASSVGMSTIFGLGIMPYISASIIFQLLGTVYPPLEKLQKEGEAGRRKINEYTRYATVVICLAQSAVWLRTLMNLGDTGGVADSEMSNIVNSTLRSDPWGFTYLFVVCTITMTAGTVLLMWIGEQIDEYGIGNGVSLLIMAGILSRMPDAGYKLLERAMREGVKLGSETGIERFLILVGLFLAVIAAVVLITQAQRRIPVHSAKHVRGRSVFGGQRQYLPLRLNQSGVMPIIFASSLLMIPGFFFQFLASQWRNVTFFQMVDRIFQGHGAIYQILYIALIYFFCYFWTAITFNPRDMANNLKDYGSFIQGYRPGGRTAAYLEQIMYRITYVGAGFLSVVAVIPTMVNAYLGVDYAIASFYGGTGLLICVSVALDLVQKIDSHLVMRNYPGLLEGEQKA